MVGESAFVFAFVLVLVWSCFVLSSRVYLPYLVSSCHLIWKSTTLIQPIQILRFYDNVPNS
jgi:hypothetical protein